MKQKEIDQIEEVYQSQGYKCLVCGKPITQRAHIIGNTVANKKMYGSLAVDSPLNWIGVCGLECNSLCDIGHASLGAGQIYSMIHSGDKEGIHKYVRENIKRKQSK